VQEADGSASIYLRDIQGALLNPVAIELVKNIPIVNDIEFTRDGTRLIASPDGNANSHSVLSINLSDKTMWNFVGDYAAVSSAGDDMAIVSGGKITFYNAQNGQLISQKSYTDSLGPVAFSPKLHMMAVLVQPEGGSSEVRFIPFANFSVPSYPAEDFVPEGEFRDIVFTPQGDRIIAAVADGILLHNIELDGATYGGLGGSEERGGLYRLAVVNDWLAVASDAGVSLSHYETHEGWTTLLWTPKGMLTGHNGAVTTVAFLPNGTHLLTGGVDGTVRLWDFINQTEIWSVGAE
jgi:WD40 repeat protein